MCLWALVCVRNVPRDLLLEYCVPKGIIPYILILSEINFLDEERNYSFYN